MTFKHSKFAAFGATAALALALAGPGFAKGHDQGSSDTPGEAVGSETVAAAQTLGAARGKGKGAQGNLGKSGDAGKPASGQ